jgi:hypothetical protein
VDRGLIDGKNISRCKQEWGIDVLLPMKRNMNIWEDASDLRPARLKGEHDEQGAIPPIRAEGTCRRANFGPTGPA